MIGPSSDVTESRSKRQRRPAVLARRFEPVEQLRRSGTRIGFATGARAQFNQSIGLFDPALKMPRAAVILETAADQPLAGREQRRARVVASEAAERRAIERRVGLRRAVDQPAGGKSKRRVSGRALTGPSLVPSLVPFLAPGL